MTKTANSHAVREPVKTENPRAQPRGRSPPRLAAPFSSRLAGRVVTGATRNRRSGWPGERWRSSRLSARVRHEGDLASSSPPSWAAANKHQTKAATSRPHARRSNAFAPSRMTKARPIATLEDEKRHASGHQHGLRPDAEEEGLQPEHPDHGGRDDDQLDGVREDTQPQVWGKHQTSECDRYQRHPFLEKSWRARACVNANPLRQRERGDQCGAGGNPRIKSFRSRVFWARRNCVRVWA